MLPNPTMDRAEIVEQVARCCAPMMSTLSHASPISRRDLLIGSWP